MDEKQARQFLDSIPGAKRAAEGVVLDGISDGEGQIGQLHILNTFRHDPELTRWEHGLQSICAKNEILRIRSIRSAHDYLLRMRVVSIDQAPRLVRVTSQRRKKYERAGRPWSLTAFYSTQNAPIRKYISRLPKRERKLARSMPFGFVPSSEVNALCLKTVVGDIIVISEVLRHYFYFMSVCLHGSDYGVEWEDRLDAGILALRLVIGSESQDFDIDPRGSLPSKSEASLRQHVDSMIGFTFGHECAHLFLGHSNTDSFSAPHGNIAAYSKTMEFDADFYAVKFIEGDTQERSTISEAAFDVFLTLQMIDVMSERWPDIPRLSVSKTHPSPIQRLEALRERLGLISFQDIRNFKESTAALAAYCDALSERIETSPQEDLLTMYGSVYLRGLGGRERRDRIDY